MVVWWAEPDTKGVFGESLLYSMNQDDLHIYKDKSIFPVTTEKEFSHKIKTC